MNPDQIRDEPRSSQLGWRDIAQGQPRLLVLVLQEPRCLPLHLPGKQLPPCCAC
jgi:hypothetical protein